MDRWTNLASFTRDNIAKRQKANSLLQPFVQCIFDPMETTQQIKENLPTSPMNGMVENQSDEPWKLADGSISSSDLIPRIISGSVGSIVTALAVTPLEVAKIHQQSSIGRNIEHQTCAGKSTSSGAVRNGWMGIGMPKKSGTPTRIFSRLESTAFASCASPPAPQGTFSTLRGIFHAEGIPGIYAGLKPTLVMTIPSTVLHLATYDELSTMLHQYHAHRQHSETSSDVSSSPRYIPVIAGSMARLFSSLAVAPLELIRTRQASMVGIQSNINSPGKSTFARRGMLEDFRVLLRTNGLSSFYVGLGPTLWRDIPFAALYWSCLEHFKSVLSESNNLGTWGHRYYHNQGKETPSSVTFLHTFVSGAGAGAVACMLTTPFDVVKTRRQMIGANSENVTMGTFGYTRQIFEQEGLAGLWKGNQTRMMKLVPAYGIMIACYEFGKQLFSNI